MDKEKFRERLKDNLLQCAKKTTETLKNLTFQQANDPKHKVRTTHEWLKKKINILQEQVKVQI